VVYTFATLDGVRSHTKLDDGAVGSFEPMIEGSRLVAIDERERTRLLAWEGCLNARDLGGYRTADGRETVWGAVVRSDSLTPLTAAGQTALVEHGIRLIVDLRLPQELKDYPNPFAEPGNHGVAYTNLSLIDPAASLGVLPEEFITLAADYKRMLDKYAPRMAQIMTAIAGAPEGGVLIHCMAGKDRTGQVSALLLDLAGVPRETIGADYALTAEYLRPRDEEWLANGPGERADREKVVAKYWPLAEVMIETLAHLDERCGGTERYLLHAGVTPDAIARLRERLLGARP
jgi:protein-tyrosine phosphatase